MVSDHLVAALESGKVRSVAGLKRISGPAEVEMSDGTKLDVDCIIWCTGYKPDYGLVKGFDPTEATTGDWEAAVGSNGKPLPRLYRNLFSLEHPDSLVYMGAAAFSSPAFQLYDIASMAVVQVWKGAWPLPSKREMNKAVDDHHAWICGLAAGGPVFPGLVMAGPWMRWANDAAGTGVNEYLGYGLKGWWFWLTNMRYCNLLMGGIYSPHIYRAFDGRRKKWAGARAEIERVNEAVRTTKVELRN